MTDNRTTELLERLRDVGNLHEFAELFGFDWQDESDWTWHDVAVKMADDFEQAITATLGRPKAKSHPYGYERDTGAYDCTRCECGCINDISATYCNDCGGEIEIDESAEKEYYDGYSKHAVFAKKHDDGSLEFCERRYVPENAATLGSEPPYDELLRCLVNDWHIRASWDGLRKFWCIELTEEGVKLRDAMHGTLTAERVRELIAPHLHARPTFDFGRHGAVWSADFQAIAYELNAEMRKAVER